jgi:nucleoside-diphosphate-sugar epimerase
MNRKVLLTGAGGFIARHTVIAFLRAGYDVRGTIRNLAKADALRASLVAHEPVAADPSRLSFVAADLNDDAPWRAAADGVGAVAHVASPFPLENPKDRNALTPAARGGALRVLGAALDAGVPRIVMTSSMVAMMYRPGRAKFFPVRENDWTDLEWNALTAYVVSKTEAERAAWALVEARGAKARFTTVNPGFVLGPALDADFGTSLEVVRMFMSGAYPAAPQAGLPIVDVRDVADLHVLAIDRPETGGRRLMAATAGLSLVEFSRLLKRLEPELARRAPGLELPAPLVRFAANFDQRLAGVSQDLGSIPQPEAGYVERLTGLKFRPLEEAVGAAARSLARYGAV